MSFIKLLSILLLLSVKNYAQENTGGSTVEEYINKKIEVINTKTTELIEHDVIKLRKPAASLACDKTNGDKIKIITDLDGYLFMLSINELLAIRVNNQNVAELYFIGTLLDIEENDPIIDIQMERWKNVYMIIIQQSMKLKVYLVKFDISDSPDISHIQKINIDSLADKFKVFRNGNDIVLIIYHINENTPNQLIFYKWQNSYFSKEITEEVDLPNKNDIFISNENVNETVIMSIGYGLGNQSTQVVALTFNQETNRWIKLQKMRFKKDYVERFSIHGKLYLIGCSTDSFCAIYKWSGAHFQRHLKISSSVFEIIKSIYSNHNIIIIEDFQNKLSLHSSSNIIGVQPGLTLSKSNEISEYSIYKSQEGLLYFVEVYKNETSMRTSFHEMSIIDVSVDERKSDAKEIDPIECVMQLKASMKNRVASIKSSELNAKHLLSNPGKLDITNKKFIDAKYVNLKNTVVGSVKMPYNVSTLKSDLTKRIVSSNIKLEEIKQSLDNGSSWKTQERASDYEFGSINVHNLIYKGSQPIFQDMMNKSQSILTFRDQMRLWNITANRLDIKENIINKIPLNKLLNATITKSVKGVKNFHTLRIDEMQINEMINNVPLTFLNSTENKLKQGRKIDFNGDINVQHLNVKTLNGFDVSKLMNDLYLKDDDSQTVIKGDLFVRSIFNVDNLFANHLMSVPINNFMTTMTDQTIETDVFISKFHASTINVNMLNHEDVSNYALINDKNYVEIPTKFMHLNVLENLNLEDTDVRENSQGLKSFVQMIKRYVIGTDASDLEQVYNGRVIIRGSLELNDLAAFSPKTRIFVGDLQIPQNITQNYWTKSTKQEIYVDTFHISNSATLNGIVTKNLNNHPVNNFLRIDNIENQGEVLLRFENAIVEGDVKGHQNNFPSLLLQLSQNVIRIDGPDTKISSPIEFRNKLVIKKLYTKSINSIAADTMVHKHLKFAVFEAPKIIDNIEVNNLLVDKSISINNYNNVNLQKFQSDAFRIDRPLLLDTLKLKSFTAFNLTVNNFEQHNFEDMIKNFEEELDFTRESNNGSNKGKRSIRIHGDATFNSNIFIDLLNGELEFNEFINLLALNTEDTQEIGGRKIFQKGLVISDDLNAENINGYPMQRLLYQSLSRGDKQAISEPMFVKNLRVKEVHTNKLNEISWNQLIDRTKLNLPLKINIDLDEIEAMNLFTNSATMDFNDMLKVIQFPKRTKWNSITAIKGSEIIFGTESFLDKLINDGVVRSRSQEIFAEVKFMEPFYMRNIKKRDYLIASRTRIWDIKALNDDSVKNNSSYEIIRGRKTVTSGYRFDANNLVIGPQCNFYSQHLNNVNVIGLNRTIYRRGESLNAVKRFQNLHVDELYIDGFLNGVPLNSIVRISHDKTKLPDLNFESLEVDNLKTYSLNTYSLLYFLKGRLKKYGAEYQHIKTYLTFDTVQFDNDTAINSINNVKMDDVVFLKSDKLQIIEGHKVVTGNVIIKGPAHINLVNNVDLVEFHRNTVNIQQDYKTDVTLKLSKLELRDGMHVTKKINDRNIDELLSSDAHSPKLNDLMTLIANVTKQITAIDHQKSVNKKRKRMLYIDVDENIDFQYKTPRSNDDTLGLAPNKCSVRNKIDFKPGPKTVSVIQKSELEMTVDLPSVQFRLNPNFECDDDEMNSRKVDVWWNYQNGKERSDSNYFQNFTFNDKVVDVKFMETSNGQVVLVIILLQHKDKSDILFLRLDKNSNDLKYQHKIVGYSESTKMVIVESTDKNHYLVVSSFKADTDDDKIFIYKFDLNRGIFVESQKPFTGGNYDMILSINVKALGIFGGRTFLIFAKTNGKQIKIYQRKDETGEFVFQRMIDDFKDNIVEVIVLYVGDKPFIIVSQKSGLFCLYEWRGIESWKSKYCGRFENIRQMKSFEYLNRQHLFLASITHNRTPSLNALAIYRQGD